MNIIILTAIFIATILLSIVLERVLDSPLYVSLAIFAVYLLLITILFVVGVSINYAIALIAIITFALISYLISAIVRFIRCICRNFLGNCCSICPRNNGEEENENRSNCTDDNLLTISCRCNNGNTQDLLSVNSNCLGSGNSEREADYGGNCGNRQTNDNSILEKNIDFNRNIFQGNRIRTIRNNYRRY